MCIRDRYQVVYSDSQGNIISLFRQEGYVKADEMPPSESMKMSGDDAWHLTEGEFDTLVVDRDGVTFTVVGAHESAASVAMLANGLPEVDVSAYDRLQNVSRNALNKMGIG